MKNLPPAPLAYSDVRKLVEEILGERALALSLEHSGYVLSRAIQDAAVVCFLEDRNDGQSVLLRQCLVYLNEHGVVSDR